jgi:hypothetical protein
VGVVLSSERTATFSTCAMRNRVDSRFGTPEVLNPSSYPGFRRRRWSIYGAERSQPAATGGKWDSPEKGKNKRKPLPPVATGAHGKGALLLVMEGVTCLAPRREVEPGALEGSQDSSDF